MFQRLLTAEESTCVKHSFKHQLDTTHVVAVGWEPHGSSPTACAAGDGGSGQLP